MLPMEGSDGLVDVRTPLFPVDSRKRASCRDRHKEIFRRLSSGKSHSYFYKNTNTNKLYINKKKMLQKGKIKNNLL
jgi:hypothetical protein